MSVGAVGAAISGGPFRLERIVGKTVFVAEQGLYENTSVVGIFDSAERAIAALHRQGDVWTRHQESPTAISWMNNKDWDSHVRIYEEELTDEGPERKPDKAIRRVHPDPDGRVVYVDEAISE